MKKAQKRQSTDFEAYCPYCNETVTGLDNDPTEEDIVKCPNCGNKFIAEFCYYTSF